MHLIYPVKGLIDLQNAYESIIKESHDSKTVILLNCGGNIDIYELFNLEEHEDLKIIICDSHRPYHRNNVNNKSQIFLMDDSTDTDILYEDSQYYDEKEQNIDEDDEDEPRRNKKTSIVESDTPSYHGFCSSGLMYALATQIGSANNDLLWYAIVGLTEQFLLQKIDKQRYQGDLQFFKAEVFSRNAQDDETYSNHSIFNHRIIYSNEFIFMLYRHWNLYDSMYYTKHINIRMEMWKTDGIYKLNELFTMMGIPLDECKQNYSALKPKYKEVLPLRLEQYASMYNIQTHCPSFLKHVNKKQISALDTVYSISAILDRTRINKDNEEIDEQEIAKHNFWKAFKALGNKNLSLIEEGFKEAIDIQKSLIKVALQVIKRGEIGKSGPFRYLVLKETVEPTLFKSSQNLSKFAHLLVDYLLESGKRKIVKPLIVVYKTKEKCTIVGVEGQHSGSAYIPK